MTGFMASVSQVGKLKRGRYGRAQPLGLPSSEFRPLHADWKTSNWCSSGMKEAGKFLTLKGLRIPTLSLLTLLTPHHSPGLVDSLAITPVSARLTW